MKDQLQREIQISQTSKRIVSLVPSQTELLVDLGLTDSIVGVTKFCVNPNDIRSNKTVVGGTKQVHFDKIKALDPDIILCNKEENTFDMVEELEQLCPVHVSDVNNIDTCLELIIMYGDLFDCEQTARALVDRIVKKKLDFEKFVKALPELKVAYFIWKDPFMVVGDNTFIDSMLRLNAFKNVCGNQLRYPQVELDDLMGLDVDVILLSSEPFPFTDEHAKSMASSFPKTEVRIVDGEMFSWYGSRLLLAFDYFKSLRQDLNLTAP